MREEGKENMLITTKKYIDATPELENYKGGIFSQDKIDLRYVPSR